MNHVLIISFWNPTKQSPNKGVFIHDQVNAICKIREDILFLEVNILPSRNKFFQKRIEESPLYLNRRISINIYSVLWKFIYANPWLIYIFIKNNFLRNNLQLKPSLIHSNVIFPCAMVGHFLAQRYACRHIISEHWSKAITILKHPLYKRLALKAYRGSTAIICVSNFLANKIGEATGNSNMLIIPNIIDSDLFCYTPKLPTIEQVHIACCATWNSPKRLDLIVSSLLQFASKTNKKFTLYVIGNGLQLEEFKTIDCPGNLIIQWLGHVKKNEIANILVKSDFFMHASEIETFSIVIAEALSTGTPVLASNVGAIPELINSSNGILVDNTLEDWLKGLHEITKRQYDHEAIAAGVAGKYSPASIGQKIDEVYKQVLQS